MNVLDLAKHLYAPMLEGVRIPPWSSGQRSMAWVWHDEGIDPAQGGVQCDPGTPNTVC
jgi:hypothetical protein